MHFIAKFLKYFIFIIFFFATKCLAEPSKNSFQQPETAKELHALLVNNTIVATTSFGNNFIEYHASDGRILGYNWDTSKNINSCWRVQNKNTVCYYYERENGQNETCWYYEWTDEKTIQGYVSDEPYKTLNATLEKGNPRNLTNFGINWSCDQQIVKYQPNRK